MYLRKIQFVIAGILIVTISGCSLVPVKQTVEINRKKESQIVDCKNVAGEARVILAVISGTSEQKKIIKLLQKFFQENYGKYTLKPSKLERVGRHYNIYSATDYCKKQYANWSQNSMIAVRARNTAIDNCITSYTGKTIYSYKRVGEDGVEGYKVKDNNSNMTLKLKMLLTGDVLFAYEVHIRQNNQDSYYQIKLINDGDNLVIYRTSTTDCYKYEWLQNNIKKLLEDNHIKILQEEFYAL